MNSKAFGAIFDNRRRKTNERQPDYRGSFRFTPQMLDEIKAEKPNDRGEIEVEFAGWDKKSANGNEYISGNISINKRSMNTQRPQRPQKEDSPKWTYDKDDEIPF